MPMTTKGSLKGAGFAGMLAAALMLGGCGGGADGAGGDLPLIKLKITVKTVSAGGKCDSVPVRVTPKNLAGEANKYANTKQSVTEVAMQGPTDENGAPMCSGEAETLPLAPGTWEFRAPLASDTYSCDFVVTEAGGTVAFVDGVPGCGAGGTTGTVEMAPPPAAPADSAAPAEGAPAGPASGG
jgi:hypothetical protein